MNGKKLPRPGSLAERLARLLGAGSALPWEALPTVESIARAAAEALLETDHTAFLQVGLADGSVVYSGLTRVGGHSVPVDHRSGALAWALETGQPLILCDVHADPRRASFPKGLPQGINAAAIFPLRGPAGTEGWLLYGTEQPEEIQDTNVQTALAGLAYWLAVHSQAHRFAGASRQRARELIAVAEIGRLLTATMAPQEPLALIVDMAVNLLDAERCALCIVQDGALRPKVARGLVPGELMDKVHRWEIVVRYWRQHASPKGFTDADFSFPDDDTHGLLLPLWQGDGLVGLLYVRRAGSFPEADRLLAQVFARMITLALQFRVTQDRVEQVERASVRAVQALVGTFAPLRGNRSRRAEDLARAIATQVGLDERRANVVALAAGLHGLRPLLEPAKASLEQIAPLRDALALLQELREREPSPAAQVVLVADALAAEPTQSLGDLAERLLERFRRDRRVSADVLTACEVVLRRRIVVDAAAPDAAAGSAALRQLSRRELEVLRELAQGRNNQEIARRLFISLKTVKAHVSSILRKLNVSDRTKAALLAVQWGIVDHRAATSDRTGAPRRRSAGHPWPPAIRPAARTGPADSAPGPPTEYADRT